MNELKDVLQIVKREKDGKTYYNLHLFGVAIKPVNQNDYSKLYYQVKGFLNNGKN